MSLNEHRRLLEKLPLAVWEYHVERQAFTFFPASMAQMTEYPQGEWTSFSPWEKGLHPEDREAALAFHRRHLGGEDVGRMEYRMIRRNGDPLTLLDVRVPPEAGNLRTGFWQEINRDQQLSLELTEKTNALDHLPVAVTLARRDGILNYVNQALASLFGYESPQELLGRPASDLFSSREEALRLYWKIRENIGFHGESTGRRKDGSSFPLRLSSSVQNHPVQGWIGMTTFLDISPQKQLGETLKVVVDNTPMVTWATDSQGVFTLSTGKGLEALGLKPGQVVGKSALEMYQDFPEIIGAIQAGLNGQSASYMVTVQDNTFDTWVTPRLNGDGQVTGVIGVSWDISLLKKTQQALAVEHQNLAQAITQAEEAIRLRDDYVSLLAHDLRTPISAVSGLIQITLTDPAIPHGVRGNLEDVVTRLRQMTDLIGKVLTMNQLVTGQMALELAPVEALILLSPALGCRPMAKAKGVDLVNLVPPDTLFQADATLFQQVVVNLVCNAIKFTSPGGRVEISLLPDGQPGLRVSDTGVGIPPDTIPYLFRKDMKTSTLGTAGELGTGLGLPLCKQIVHAHGGEILVQSELGRGSVFSILLPAHPASSAIRTLNS
ncbi:MAG: PAS domain S-box protein [Deltaproteobacteria bacterium]|nr:PAS domain S-box protein [Deltaproteobacteria bacterium]